MAVDPATQFPADPPAPPSVVAAVQASGQAATSAAEDLFAHAGKAGPSTTEFWAPIVYPLVAFVVVFGLTFLAAHGFATGSQLQVLIPSAAGTIASGLAHIAAAIYVRARTLLKAELLRAGLAKG